MYCTYNQRILEEERLGFIELNHVCVKAQCVTRLTTAFYNNVYLTIPIGPVRHTIAGYLRIPTGLVFLEAYSSYCYSIAPKYSIHLSIEVALVFMLRLTHHDISPYEVEVVKALDFRQQYTTISIRRVINRMVAHIVSPLPAGGGWCEEVIPFKKLYHYPRRGSSTVRD
jgi:hypothetical protein